MRSLERALILSDWILMRREGHGCTQGPCEDIGRRWTLRAQERDLRRNQPCPCLDLGHAASRTVEKSLCKPPVCGVCYGLLSHLAARMEKDCRVTGIWVSLDFYELCLQPGGSLSLSGPSANPWALGINRVKRLVWVRGRRTSGWSRVHDNGDPGALSI